LESLNENYEKFGDSKELSFNERSI